jgi:hypothetical protein
MKSLPSKPFFIQKFSQLKILLRFHFVISLSHSLNRHIKKKKKLEKLKEQNE